MRKKKKLYVEDESTISLNICFPFYKNLQKKGFIICCNNTQKCNDIYEMLTIQIYKYLINKHISAYNKIKNKEKPLDFV